MDQGRFGDGFLGNDAFDLQHVGRAFSTRLLGLLDRIKHPFGDRLAQYGGMIFSSSSITVEAILMRPIQ